MIGSRAYSLWGQWGFQPKGACTLNARNLSADVLVPAFPGSRLVEWGCQGFPFFSLAFLTSPSPPASGVCAGSGVASGSSPSLDIPEMSVRR